jgi:hypothetical protein
MTQITIGRRNLLGLAGLGVAQALLTACGQGGPTAQWNSNSSAKPGGSAPPTPSPSTSGQPVHVRLYESDGGVYGVAMPIIAYLSTAITSSRAFTAATSVTVNGSPAQGAWYFQRSAIYKDYPVEAHYRLQDYWPAHAKIHLDLPVAGLSAGTGLVFDNSLMLDMSTGARNIATVDGATERMIVTSDDVQVFLDLVKERSRKRNAEAVLSERDMVKRSQEEGVKNFPEREGYRQKEP